MTTDPNIRAATDARCPMCRSLLTSMNGKHEFRMFPSEAARVDLFEDGNLHDLTVQPTPVAQDFIATFVPCGCKWRAWGLQSYVLNIIGTETGATFEFCHRQHDSRYAMYIMTHERTPDA